MTDLSQRLANLSPQQRKMLQHRLQNRDTASEPIAIVGMSCRFPGAPNLQAFWRLIEEGIDATSEIPGDRWDVDALYDPTGEQAGKMSVRRAGLIENIDQFDPQFFGVSPREAARMDPQQRLLLEVCWEALENGGIAPNSIAGTAAGVFVGIGGNDYSKVPAQCDGYYLQIDAHVGTGNALSIAANRISYILDLHGPSLAVDTACSSSTMATHLAVQSLRNRECSVALSGGVNAILTPETTIAFSKARMLSPDGRCRPFDAGANGYVRGEGCGVLVLKRLCDAVEHGDHIFAVIRSTATNQDGRTSGITAPNAISQQAVIRAALSQAGLQPDQVDYIEAHGTGTPLGDPIEVEALRQVFRRQSPDDEPCYVTSVKANVGHMETVSGIAGIIKVALMMHHQKIPAQLHLEHLNPRISLADSRLVIPTQSLAWPVAQSPRIAGVSSFGFGGSNTHVVLQSPAIAAQQTSVENEPRIDRTRHLVTLSAKSQPALSAGVERLASYIAEHPEAPIADLASTLNRGRAHFTHRAAMVTSGTEQLRQQLLQLQAEKKPHGVKLGVVSAGQRPQVSFLFTGQGSQCVDMGRGLYSTQPAFRQVLQQCDEILRDLLPRPLLTVLYPEVDGAAAGASDVAADINETRYTQPALFAVEYALATLWQSWGVEPTAVIGHSVGEYVAACVAGVLSLEDALRLIAHRARLMQNLPAGGQMVVVFESVEQVASILQELDADGSVSIAASNGPENTVVSGAGDTIQTVIDRCEQMGVATQRLRVSHAFHSPLMQPILEEFHQLAAACTFRKPCIPLISNVTGKVHQSPWDADYLCQHIRGTVRFAEGMSSLAALNPDVYLEVGPAPVLIGMGRRCLNESSALWLPSLRHGQHDEEVILQTAAELDVAGAALNWEAFDKPWRRERLLLPTYPFERQRCWFEPTTATPRGLRAPAIQGESHQRLLGNAVPTALNQRIFQRQLASNDPSYLAEHRVQDSVAFPAAGYVELALGAATQTFGPGGHRIDDLLIQQAMLLPDHTERVLQTIVGTEAGGSASIEIASSLGSSQTGSPWTLHAYGRITSGSDVAEASVSAPPQYHSVLSRVFDVQTGDQFYDVMTARKLQYGPRFRVLKSLSRTADEAFGEVQLDPAVMGELADYHLHPALGDALFQTCAGLVPAESDGSYSPFTYMPTRVQTARVLQKPAGRLWTYGRRHAGVSEPSPEFVDADVWLINEAGEIVAEFAAVRIIRVGQMGIAGAAPRLEDSLYNLMWQATERSEERLADDFGNQTWLIFADANGLGDALALRLRSAGATTVVVRPGDGFECLTAPDSRVDEFRIRPDHVPDYERLFASFSDPDPAPLVGTIHLWSLNDDAAEPEASDIQQNVMLGAESSLRLIQQLVRHTGTRADFRASWRGLWFATCGAQNVDGYGTNIHVAQAPLWGLARVAAVEHPELLSRLIDLESRDPLPDRVGELWDEIQCGNDEDQVAYRGGRRHVARLQHAPQALRQPQMSATSRSIPSGPYRLRFAEAGSFDTLHFEGCQRARPQGSEVEVKIAAAGLNFSDVLKAMGLYPGITDPVVPLGIECSGVVTDVGTAATRFKIGDEVFGVAPFSFGSHALTAEYALSAKPAGIKDSDAATIPIAFMTAYYGLVHLADLQPGERVLIHAGAGGVGLAAIQIAHHLSAEVFATAGSDEKRSFLRTQGVEHVFDSRSVEFAEQIRQVTNREGVDVVLNSLPGEAIPKSLSILRAYGRFLEIGKTDIYQNRLLGLAPFQDNLSYFAVDLDRILRQRPQVITRLLESLSKHFAAGDFKPLAMTEFAADQIADAFRYMAQRKNIGKVVVTMSERATEQARSHSDGERSSSAGTVLITGGLGALGLSVAEDLVDQGETHVVLLGRREPNDQQLATVGRLRERAKVQVVAGDVSHIDSLRDALQQIAVDFPPLRAVYHAAGVLDDGLLFDMSAERWLNPLAPKIQGTWNLHQATLDQPIERFVLFSSIAALLGSPGQGNYAAANAFLDTFAAYRRSHGLPAISINWGPWADAGMAANAEAGQQLRARGLAMIQTSPGLQLMRRLVAAGVDNVAVMQVDWSKMLRDGRPVRPYLAEFAQPLSAIGKAADQSIDRKFVETLKEVTAQQREQRLQQYLVDELARIMGWEASRIDRHQPLSQLGMDSLMAMELKNNIERQLGVDIPMGAFIESPTIASLSSHVSAGFKNAEVAGHGEPTTRPYRVLVPLKASGNKPPWFCVHPLGGNAGCYADLAKHAEADQPVIGVWGRGADGLSAPHPSLQAMIDDYVSAIEEYQPQGPYHVLGWSAGGVYAYEIARRLRENGHEVAILALLDTPLPSIYDNVDLGDDARFLYDFTHFSNIFLQSKMRVTYEQLCQLSHDGALQVILDEAKREGLLSANASAHYIERLIDTARAHVRFIKEYRLQDFDQEIQLYRPEITEALENISGQSWDDDLGWAWHIGSQLTVHHTPGDHFTMLLDECAAELCQKLMRQCHDRPNKHPVHY